MTTKDDNTVTLPGSRHKAGCPVCGRPSERAYRPFCSRHCADVDLARWLGGVYRVEVDDPDADTEDDPEKG